MQIDHRQILKLLGTLNEISLAMRERPNTVRGWIRRNSIPADRWVKVLRLAREKRVYVSPEDLMKPVEREAA